MNRNSLPIFLILLFTGSALSQQIPTPAPQTATVFGTVVSGDTGQPLPKAKVRLATPRGSKVWATTTDTEGRYEFTDVQPGSYDVRVEKPGFQFLDSSALFFEVIAGQKKQVETVRMNPAGSLLVRVLDQDGEPIPRAKVWLFRRVYQIAGSFLYSSNALRTNDSGEIRSYSIPYGDLYAAATFDPLEGATETQSNRTTYPLVFYPGVLNASDAAPIQIRGSEQITTEIFLAPVRPFRIRGMIVGQHSPSSVSLHRNLQGDEGVTIDAAKTGAFEFTNVTAGEYILEADSFDTAIRRARLKLKIDNDVEGLQVPLGPPEITYTGRIKAENVANKDMSSLSVRFQNLDAPAFTLADANHLIATPNPDGQFSISFEPGGRYLPEIIATDNR